MKPILTPLVSIILLTGCSIFNKPDYDWKPHPIVEEVDCCITDVQVHGAIYSALLKLRWNIKEKTENGFVANIQCDNLQDTQQIKVSFENTNRYYTITPEQTISNIYEYRNCIESKTKKINKYIKKYIKKSIKRNAKKELNRLN